MKIFVTGSTGFVGKHFLAQLLPVLDQGSTVYTLVRKAIKSTDSRIIPLIGALSDLKEFREHIVSCDYVFHLAAYATYYGQDTQFEAANILPTEELVGILKQSTALKNFVYVSTIGAMDRAPGDSCRGPIGANDRCFPRSAYGRSKLAAEKRIQTSGLPFTILRPTWVFGPGMRANSHINQFVTMVAKGSFATQFAFPGRVSLISVDDLASALVHAIGNQAIVGKSYIAETHAMALGDIFSLIYRTLHGKELRQFPVPPLRFVVRYSHRFLPLALSNLFIDYLFASDVNFARDFQQGEPKRLEAQIRDIVDTNAFVSGVTVLTGANSGIGYALAKKLNEQGAKLVLVDKNTDRLSEFAHQTVLKVNLAQVDQTLQLANQLKGVKIRCLINNAGVGFRRSLETISMTELYETFHVNMLSPVLLIKELLPQLVQDQTTIVNVASSVAYNPLPQMSLYAASKAFISILSEALSYELRRTNRVLTVSPGGTWTNFQSSGGVAVQQGGKGLLSPEYVASQILGAIDSRKKILILGLKTKILLLVARVLPRSLNVRFWGVLFEQLR